jgi:hypothetical protein
MLRKADRLYRFSEFEHNDELPGITAVNMSSPERQGKPMTPRYLEPASAIKVPDLTCSLHRSSWWGGWRRDDGSLAAYCNLVILNELGVINTILGHAEAPAAVNGLIGTLAEHAPVRAVHYLTLASSGTTLAAFKRRVGFREVRVEKEASLLGRSGAARPSDRSREMVSA